MQYDAGVPHNFYDILNIKNTHWLNEHPDFILLESHDFS